MAECSLSTGKIGLPMRFAASITKWPPVTSASLFASSTCRFAPSASITLCSPAMPTTLTSTMSAGTSAAATRSASSPMTQRQKRTSSGISLIGMGSVRPATSGRNSRTCSNSFSRLLRAVSATTRNSSGCRLTSSSACVPIDPVDPRMAMVCMSIRPPTSVTDLGRCPEPCKGQRKWDEVPPLTLFRDSVARICILYPRVKP